jgi:magnesium transporter
MISKSSKNIESIVHEITYHRDDRMRLFRELTLSKRAAIFEQLTPYVEQYILNNLGTEEIIELLDEFDLQRAENVLAKVRDVKKRKKLAYRLQSDLKEKAEYFLRFHPKAGFNLMSFNYVLLSENATIAQAADAIDEHYREVGRLPEVLVHRDGVCIGEVKPGVLVRETMNKKLKSFVTTVPTIVYTEELPEIIDLFTKTKQGIVVVLDSDNSVVGIVYADDALRLLGTDPAASLYDFAGVSDNEHATDGMWSKVKHRYKWLIINLGTGFLAAGVVSLFEDTINQLVVLAMYMPIIAGMGGNAATQTLAVIVRGITVGEISLRDSMKPIMNEAGAGLINGIINGLIVAVVAYAVNGDPFLGLVVGCALVFNLAVAGFFGTLIPLIMKSLGKDPATSATIFITTATDVLGFLAFLGLATVILI